MSPQESEFERRSYVQFRRIETDRFDEGVKRQHDPRNDGYYDLDWILKKGIEFNKKWSESLCKNCKNYKECGFKLATECEKYFKEFSD